MSWYSVPSVVCVLPPPIQRIVVDPPPPVADMYEINVQKNKDGKAVSGEFGFHTATAIRRNEGSVAHLTGWDIEALKRGEKSLWGNEMQKRGRITNAKNADAKRAWHDGCDAAQIAKSVGFSLSWAEKRHSAFEWALREETK